MDDAPFATIPWLSNRRVPHAHRPVQPIYLSAQRVITTTRCVLCGRPKDDGVHIDADGHAAASVGESGRR